MNTNNREEKYTGNLISVLIPVHQRENYVLEAIESVINNGLDKSRFEIIVIIDFSNKNLDLEMKAKGVKVIETDCQSTGDKISMGIKAAIGEIVVFLDDDDLFLPGKLEHVLKVFSVAQVTFYHNEKIPVNDKLVKLDYLRPRKTKNKISIDTSKSGSRKFLRAMDKGASCNHSCMAIRRNSYLPFVDLISNSKFSIDDVIFFIGLSTKGLIIVDNDLFTLNRIHSTDSTSRYRGNNVQFIDKFLESEPRFLKSLEILRFGIQTNAVLKAIDFEIAKRRITLNIASSKRIFEFSKDDVSNILVTTLRTGTKSGFLTILAIIIHVINRNLSVKLMQNYFINT